MKVDSLVRENVKNLSPFRSARSEFKGSAEIMLDANELPFDTSINRYPDPYQIELKKKIGEIKNLSIDEIILGNGSDEIIDLITRTFCEPERDVVRYITPSFGMYEVIADINNVIKEPIRLNDDFQLDLERCLDNQSDNHKLIFLCSPNNPTSNNLKYSDMLHVLRAWKGLVVIDEAYIQFSDQNSLLDELRTFDNLIILQTFSKSFGGAGLRLGMGFANSTIISYLNKIKPPYNVNSYSQNTALEILNKKEHYEQLIQVIKKERDQLADTLSKIDGIVKIFPSDANFLLVRCVKHKELYNFLVSNGVIVRDRSGLPGCDNCLRITIGLQEENEKLIAFIKDFYR